jgi:thiol-disulfide isomerase/thioredoxin
MSDSSLPHPPSGADQRWVVCLCADWCGTCRDYRPAFDQVTAQYPGLRFLWLDIEDEAELVGELDIETFPTLLIADGARIRFAGPLLPHAGTLSRLLEALDDDSPAAQPAEPALHALVQTLHQKISAGKISG